MRERTAVHGHLRRAENHQLRRMYAVMIAKDWSAREWSRRAELVQEVNVQQLLMKLAKASDSEQVLGHAATIVKLAIAAGVTTDWLLTGRVLTDADRSLALTLRRLTRGVEEC